MPSTISSVSSGRIASANPDFYAIWHNILLPNSIESRFDQFFIDSSDVIKKMELYNCWELIALLIGENCIQLSIILDPSDDIRKTINRDDTFLV